MTAWTKKNGIEKLAKLGLKPATLDLEAAAAYLGLTPRVFKREVEAGRLPPPLNTGTRRQLWSLKALDRFLDSGQNAERDSQSVDPIMAAIDNATVN